MENLAILPELIGYGVVLGSIITLGAVGLTLIALIIYSMLFGAPLALLAAIYTSEFLHPRVKA